jgi:hypothetical protein
MELIIIFALIVLICITSFQKSCIEHMDINYPNKKYNLCIMAIFKNEQDYMKEWLDYHIDQGFDHFYLYCNDLQINNYVYLNNYKEYITLIEWTTEKNDINGTIQRKAYTDCIKTYNNEYRYIMMLDLDEFVVNTMGQKVIEYINSLSHNNVSAIKIPRFNFGSNGHLIKPDGRVMDNYKQREKICSSYKTLANSNYINTNKKFYGVHDFNLFDHGKIYNTYFSYNNGGFPSKCHKDDINETPLIINHYYTKSYEEYMKRCDLWKDGGVNNIKYRKDCENNFYKNDVNEIKI